MCLFGDSLSLSLSLPLAASDGFLWIGRAQHHDALTGTFCANAEGCAGEDQDVGSHDVLGSYTQMLDLALTGAERVFAAVAGAVVHGAAAASGAAPQYTTDLQTFGDLLMGDGTGGGDAELLVFNPHAHSLTEGIAVPVPLCAVELKDALTGKPVPSQTTATLQISSGTAPNFDFELAFVPTLPPLSFRRFLVSPVRNAVGSAYFGKGCPSSSAKGTATAISHVQVHGKRPAECAGGSRDASSCRDDRTPAPPPPPPPPLVSLENSFVRVDIDPTRGVVGVMDKPAGVYHPLRAALVEFSMSDEAFESAGPAYVMGVKDTGSPFLGVQTFPPKSLQCHAWRQTRGCNGQGTRDPTKDLACERPVPANVSGYCECALTVGLNEWEIVELMISDCGRPDRPAFTCAVECAKGGVRNVTSVGATLATGPLLHEAWIQVTTEHRERVRIWQTSDPSLGRTIQFGHRVGALSPLSEVAARFTLSESEESTMSTLFTEDNAYELVPHVPGALGLNVSRRVFPAQASSLLYDGRSGVQLSLALDRSHGIAALTNGSVDVLLHRRARAFRTGEGTVVLDDVDRIFTVTWLALGERQVTNRQRISMKTRLHHPPVLAFAPRAPNPTAPNPTARKLTAVRTTARTARTALALHLPSADELSETTLADELPTQLHLQSVRAINSNGNSNGTTLLVRLQHLYGAHEDASLSVPVQLDLPRFLASIMPAATKLSEPREMALDGFRPAAARRARRRMPTSQAGSHGPSAPALGCLKCCEEPLPDGTCCCLVEGCPPLPPSCPSPRASVVTSRGGAGGAGLVTLRPMELLTFQVDVL